MGARPVALAIAGMALAGWLRAAEPEDLMPYLQGYEWQLEAERFEALGPGIVPALMTIAADPEHPRFIRARALDVLGLFPDDRVYRFYVDRFEAAQGKVTKRQLLGTLCRTFGASRGDAVGRHAVPLLLHPDPHTRITAAKCLRRIGGAFEQSLTGYRAAVTSDWELRAVFGTEELRTD